MPKSQSLRLGVEELQPLQTSRVPVPNPALRAEAVVVVVEGEGEDEAGAQGGVGAEGLPPQTIPMSRSDP